MNTRYKSNAATSPILYESQLKTLEMETVKLSTEINDKTVTIKTPVFTGKEKLEGFHHVVERFKFATRKLLVVEAEEFVEQFSNVLTDDPFNEWMELV